MKKKLLLFAAALLIIKGVATQETLAEENRAHDTHVHGKGQLLVAVDGGLLSIELESPAVNIVGFEHFPGNAEEKERVRAVVDKLKDGFQLFEPPATARCRMTDSHVNSAMLEKDDDGGHGEEERHAEFHATYSFRCDIPQELTYLDVQLFRYFPAMVELKVRFVTATGQGAAELTPDVSRFAF